MTTLTTATARAEMKAALIRPKKRNIVSVLLKIDNKTSRLAETKRLATWVTREANAVPIQRTSSLIP
jgi:hypothetical protein